MSSSMVTGHTLNNNCQIFRINTGLPHTQGIQGNSGNFEVKENLRKTQGNSGNFDLFFKLRETQGSFVFSKKSGKF